MPSTAATIAHVHPFTHVLTIPCNHCGMVNEVTPINVFRDGTATYGSAMDYCGYCENGMNYVEVWSEEPAKSGATTENTVLVNVEDKAKELLSSIGIDSVSTGPTVTISLADLEAIAAKVASLTPPF